MKNNIKFLCHLRYKVLEEIFGDYREINRAEIKEMTVKEMNDFVKTYPRCELNILKEIIPAQTPNLSEKKGFHIQQALVELAKASSITTIANQHHIDKAIELLKEYEANGGTPEVDNTVGQVSISFSPIELAKLVDILSIGQKYTKDWEFKMNMVIKLLTNKPVETTKEQPDQEIIVEVRGGVAYCDNPLVKIVDYDNN